jgi:hypothetical protein
VERLEAQLAGKSDEERIRLSMLAMVASAQSMAQRLNELSQNVQSAQRPSGSRPGA